MVIIFVEQSTHYAISISCWPMASCRSLSKLNTNLWPHRRVCYFNIYTHGLLTHVISREQCEQKIFQVLLNMIPGLQEHLTAGSEDKVLIVAKLVSFLHGAQLDQIIDRSGRFRKECLVPGVMTLKVWRVLCWSGSLQKVRYSIIWLLEMSNLTVVSIMNTPVPFFAQWTWTGLINSMLLYHDKSKIDWNIKLFQC